MNQAIHPSLNKIYPIAAHAEGIYIYDKSGKAYLDGSSGPVACSLGHSHPKICEAIRRQLGKIQYAHRSMFATDESEKLAARLCAISPGRTYAHAFFVNSGSEAIETAMKVAIQYWQEVGMPTKDKFITRWKSYHGMTTGALSLSGFRTRRKLFESTLAKFPRLSSDLERDSLEEHEAEFEKALFEVGAENLAGFVAEPVVGAAGTALLPPAGYYQRFRALCDKHKILFIADEVMTGVGRTGSWFGLDHWSTSADIVAIGKSLGAGYAPIAATLMTDKVLDPIRMGVGTIMSGHTYSGHPLSCATALLVIEVIEEDSLLQNIRSREAQLRDGLKVLQGVFSFIQVVRGKGLLLGMEFDRAKAALQSKFLECCFRDGLLLYPSAGGPQGTDDNGVLIAPPYTITQLETDQLLAKMEGALKAIAI